MKYKINNLFNLSLLTRKTALILSMLFIFPAWAGVTVGGTRVIYDGNKKEASISVINSDETKPYLIQSFINSNTKGEKPPFVVTPPLFRLDAGKESTLRIVRTGGHLPDDRESVFYLNVKSIPSVQENEQNTLLIAVKTRIKLFYRPKGISGDAEDAYKSLMFRRIGNQLEVKNPSNYYVTLGQIRVNGKALAGADMIAPQGVSYFLLPSDSAGCSVKWSSINSYGGVSPEITQKLR
ncbi:molecular chaperone [Yersinia nurmii]|uniref:Fimbrial chaperone protein n=1 Tax=Yersinia nurmii TaxID=685706 RepID=A0AAW7K133_9GAMM|nr:molecular chaperone [Yersinia nurmii]MDN0086935.1 molecular chaperone [Yersinia nurmii]CNE30557.1 putative fimbrial chaperone protein [Yersinia nurmii]